MAWSTEATAIMRRIVAAQDVDIMIFNADIERPRDRWVLEFVQERAGRRKPNLLLILVTNGGDPDAAYRICRTLQRAYKKITVIVAGICKSAGTLILLGANELAFVEGGEIGPLDIQLAKKDELLGSESGLTVMTALSAVHENAQEAFYHFLTSLTTKSNGRITVRTASDIAAKLTEALYSRISQQIDPIHMGEVNRSMAIAEKYGTRLKEKGGNLKEDTLKKLITDYPSHGFVIDKEEAAQLFTKVRDCNLDEVALIEEFGWVARTPYSRSWIRFISDDILEEDEANAAAARKAVLEQPGVNGVGAPQAAGNIPQE